MTIRFRVFKTPARRRGREDDGSRVNVYVRLRDGSTVDQTVRTGVLVNPNWWDSRREMVRVFSGCPVDESSAVNARLSELRSRIASKYVIMHFDGTVEPDWLKETVREIELRTEKGCYLFNSVFGVFLEQYEISATRRKQYEALGRTVERYETYMGHKMKYVRSWQMDIRKVDERELDRLWNYIKHEDEIYRSMPEVFEEFAEKRAPKARGGNTMNDIFKKLRTFFLWCVRTGRIPTSPFEKFRICGEVYGTPVFLTADEVHQLAATDLHKWPHLERQRDIFVFQCNVGCRVGDLVRLQKDDVVNGTLSYMPQKTMRERPRTVTVPLNAMARAIVSKYESTPGVKLLPFISSQKYNAVIKTVMEKAGLTRTVVILDPLTRTDRKARLCDIASSHMARRTFAGNLYKKVKDPSLVASLTGHTEGSKAFSRYRAIDDEMKAEIVSLLD